MLELYITLVSFQNYTEDLYYINTYSRSHASGNLTFCAHPSRAVFRSTVEAEWKWLFIQ